MAPANASPTVTIDALLRQAANPDTTAQILTCLRDKPSLASSGDANGYTLLHAAASYAQHDLLRALVREFHCDVNVRDADGETPLFYAEDVETARALVNDLSADLETMNEEGVSVAENAAQQADDEEGSPRQRWIGVCDYLRQAEGSDGQNHSGVTRQEEEDARAPPRLPEGMRIDMRAVPEAEAEEGGEPDSDFRRRIQQLAARGDYESAEGQGELRRLVEDALGGLKENANDGGQEAAKARRLE